MDKTMCELFAGVGGFRLGMERLNSGWETVWFSQWEPGKKKQWAHDCYEEHFGKCEDLGGRTDRTGQDISLMPKTDIPNISLIVAGFPCQPFSKAATGAKGLDDKNKGILWWQIRDTLAAKHPAFCLFENVDRLLKSPSSRRGRDFGVILNSLSGLGYSAEWRVVNAALYGGAQRRRRTFIFAYRNDTEYGKMMAEKVANLILERDGLMAKAFPIISHEDIAETVLQKDATQVYEEFVFNFKNAGYMHEGHIYTTTIAEAEEPSVPISAILESDVDEKYYIHEDKLPKWEYLKGAKKIERESASGYKYTFSEGPVAFPDPSDRPGRTMLTSESTLNRSTHVVKDPETERLRLLTPTEAERLNGFDDGWTEGMPERMRYFCMGNALVVPMITRMGAVLDQIIEDEP